MPIIAIWPIEHDGVVYPPGKLITNLHENEEKRLVEKEVAKYPQEEQDNAAVIVNSTDDHKTTSVDQFNALDHVLKKMTKNALLSYGEKAGVVEINNTMKNADIANMILTEARSKGVDLDAFTDEHLVVFAKSVDIETADMDRENMLDAIEQKFQV